MNKAKNLLVLFLAIAAMAVARQASATVTYTVFDTFAGHTPNRVTDAPHHVCMANWLNAIGAVGDEALLTTVADGTSSDYQAQTFGNAGIEVNCVPASAYAGVASVVVSNFTEADQQCTSTVVDPLIPGPPSNFWSLSGFLEATGTAGGFAAINLQSISPYVQNLQMLAACGETDSASVMRYQFLNAAGNQVNIASSAITKFEVARGSVQALIPVQQGQCFVGQAEGGGQSDRVNYNAGGSWVADATHISQTELFVWCLNFALQ
jgi:hypothetical protein